MLKKHLKVIGAFCKTEIQQAMANRLGGLAWVINGSIGSLLMMYIWTLITPDKGFVITYFLGIILMSRLTGSWSFGEIADGIKDGSIAQVLLKPYHYMFQEFAHDTGQRINRLISMIPFLIILGIIFSSSLQLPTWDKILISIPAIICGYSINLFFGSFLALFTIWAGDSDGIGRTYEIIADLADGYLIPYFFIPIVLRNVLSLTPFRYIISFPVEIMLNRLNTHEILYGYSILIFWTVASFLLYRWLDKESVKNFVAYGS